MPPASRVKDKASCPADSHGKPCCSHGVTGPAVAGSPDVIVNGQPVLRIGDPGVHSACCGPNTWKCAEGSATVFVNSIPVVRLGDATAHCGGSGKMIEGSPNVFIGGPSIGVGGSLSPAPPICPQCEAARLAGASVSTASPHPVHALSGCKFLNEEPDFTFPGRIPLAWTRTYSSLNTHDGPLGPGWSVPYFLHLSVNKPVLGPEDAPHCLINPQGRAIPFAALEAGECTFQPSEGLTLSRNYDEVYTLEAGSVFFRFATSEGEHEQHLRLEKIEDRNGNFILLEYDEQGRLIKLDNQSGYLALGYSETFPQRISSVYGSFRHEADEKITLRMLAAYEYDRSGRLASIALADGEIRRAFTYHDEGPGTGLMASHTLPSGLRCDYVWDAFPDHPRVVRHGTNDGMRWVSSYTFLPDGGESTVTDSLGRTRAWRWNKTYLPLSYTNAVGENWQLQWNGQNQPTQCILPNGGKYAYSYDKSGNLTRVIDPIGARVSFFWHGRYPMLLRATDADGNSTRFKYDDNGNRIYTLHPDGGEEHFRYDASGNLIERLTPLGDIHRYEWDDAGRLVCYRDCSDHVYSLEYDAHGYLAASTDPLGQTRSIERDLLGNPLVAQYPDGSTAQYTWDKAGRMTSVADALGRITHYRYNRQDQLVEEKDALGGMTSMRYDLAGNLQSLTNPNGEEYHFSYDAEGRRLSYTGLDDVSNDYALDAMGLPTDVRLATDTDLETFVSYTRDKLGRVTKRSGDTGVIEYSYSPAGRLLRLKQEDDQGRKTGEISRDYDVMGRLTEEKSRVLLHSGDMVERTLRHEYDLAGNRIRSLLPDGAIAEFTPCSSGHVHQISFMAGPDAPEQIISAFERDALNRETLRTQGQLYSKRAYDLLSRITHMHSASFDPESQMRSLGVSFDTSPLVNKTFSYDVNGELIQSEDVFNGSQHHEYDALGRVVSTTRQRSEYALLLGEATGKSLDGQDAVNKLFLEEHFLYDPAGNLFSTGTGQFSPGRRERPADPGWVRFDNASGRRSGLHVAHNRLDAMDDFTFFHDSRGRVVEKRCSASGEVWKYYYNSDNQLIEAHAFPASGFVRTRFSYDALDRRVTSLNGASETLFTWDGLRLVREERGTHAVTYFYEQGSHAPLARVDARNSLAQGAIHSATFTEPQKVFYYYCNPAGLPEDLTNSEGEVVWRGRYSTWGKLVYEHTTRHAPAGFSQPLRMQGQYDDGTTGLYYNTFRYYDADAGRFTAEDPIGLMGGDNLYHYAPNPMKWIDPAGLFLAPIFLAPAIVALQRAMPMLRGLCAEATAMAQRLGAALESSPYRDYIISGKELIEGLLPIPGVSAPPLATVAGSVAKEYLNIETMGDRLVQFQMGSWE